jgi:type II secretory pathway component PulK
MDLDTFTELLSYIGMISILAAFVMETRNVVHSKQTSYLALMAVGSALLGIRAYLIDEWAFLILEAAWCAAAVVAYVQGKQFDLSTEIDASS